MIFMQFQNELSSHAHCFPTLNHALPCFNITTSWSLFCWSYFIDFSSLSPQWLHPWFHFIAYADDCTFLMIILAILSTKFALSLNLLLMKLHSSSSEYASCVNSFAGKDAIWTPFTITCSPQYLVSFLVTFLTALLLIYFDFSSHIRIDLGPGFWWKACLTSLWPCSLISIMSRSASFLG